MKSASWVFLLTVVTASGFAQAAPDKVTSPQVDADGRVTFRLRAPKAAEVKLWGEWIARYNTVEPMKRLDNGVWTATVGPLPPAIY